MAWDDWSEHVGDACPRCHGAGVLDEGDKGHGACPACGGSGEVDPDADGPPEADDPEDPS